MPQSKAPAKRRNEQRTRPTTPADVASISSIVQQPNSEMVEVRYNEVVPQRIEGSLDDPAIRQLLMMASEDAASAGDARRFGGPAGGRVPRRATAAMPRAFAMR